MIHPIRFARRVAGAFARLEEFFDGAWDVPLEIPTVAEAPPSPKVIPPVHDERRPPC